jgi:hypothetical protein
MGQGSKGCTYSLLYGSGSRGQTSESRIATIDDTERLSVHSVSRRTLKALDQKIRPTKPGYSNRSIATSEEKQKGWQSKLLW